MATLPFSAPAIAAVGLLLLAQQVTSAARAGPAALPNSQRLTAPGPPAGSPPGGLVAPPQISDSAPVAPLSEKAFAALLREEDLDQLNLGCARILQEDNIPRLRLLQTRLLEVRPAPQPLPVVLANAEVLLSCRAPQGALTVLERYGPGPGAERVQWLLLEWRAATAALDHRRAALALDRLSGGSSHRLGQLTLPIRRREDGTVVSRSALEVLAAHLEARGYPAQAGRVLLLQGEDGVASADRLARAAALLEGLPVAEREAILERALEQAAAAGAWSLVGDLLDAQAALVAQPASRAENRRLRLSPRLDDAYGEWLLRRADPASRERAQRLEVQLRSPREPGGHAYPDLQPPPAPAVSPPSPSAP